MEKSTPSCLKSTKGLYINSLHHNVPRGTLWRDTLIRPKIAILAGAPDCGLLKTKPEKSSFIQRGRSLALTAVRWFAEIRSRYCARGRGWRGQGTESASCGWLRQTPAPPASDSVTVAVTVARSRRPISRTAEHNPATCGLAHASRSLARSLALVALGGLSFPELQHLDCWDTTGVQLRAWPRSLVPSHDTLHQ